MKTYNRKTKKWEEVSKENVGSLKKRDLCKGGKPHDPILVLPSYVRTSSSLLGIDVAEKYYKLEEEIYAYIDSKKGDYEALGISPQHFGYNTTVNKYYICSVCNKYL